jgi:lysophospholipase L1-like esterase
MRHTIRLSLVLLWSAPLGACDNAEQPSTGHQAAGAGGLAPAAGGGAGGGAAPIQAGTAPGGMKGDDDSANGGSAGSGGNVSQGGALAQAGASVGQAGSSGGAAAGAGAGGTAQAGAATQAGNGAGGSAGYRPCPASGSCKIMPFGDSITDGYNADTPGGYRVELFRLAHAAGKDITFVGSSQNGPDMVDGVPFPHQHEGHSGWTIAPAGGRSGISTLVATVMPQFKPHIVLLMIGTNDAIDNYDMPNAPKRLGVLLDSIYAQLPTVMVLVAQPIPGRDDGSKGDDTGLSARIKTFCDAIPAIAQARADQGKHIQVVDLNTPFAPKASLLEDQWHPNKAGYELLGQRWYAALAPLAAKD